MDDTMPTRERLGSQEGEADRDGQGDETSPAPADRPTPWQTFSARVISMVSRKGGVGKTTSCVNLGAALALSGHSVLLVGVDPQCGISRSLGYQRRNLNGSLQEIFTSSVDLSHLAYATPLKNLYFVSPNIWSLEQEEAFTHAMASQGQTFLQQIDRARNLYDSIIIDCPPGLHPATRTALLASDGYLVPVQAEELCRDSLSRLLAFIAAFREKAFAESNLGIAQDQPAPLSLVGMFLTMVSSRTRICRHVAAEVKREYADHLFQTAIPRSTRLSEMALRGKPSVIFDRRSASSRAYFDLMDELMARYQQGHSREPVTVTSELARPQPELRREETTAGTPRGKEPAGRTGNDRERSVNSGVADDSPAAPQEQKIADAAVNDWQRQGPAGNNEPLLDDLETWPEVPEPESAESLLDTEFTGRTEDLVSLDDLLAEEEKLAGGEDDSEDTIWGLRRRFKDRYN